MDKLHSTVVAVESGNITLDLILLKYISDSIEESGTMRYQKADREPVTAILSLARLSVVRTGSY